MYKITSIISRVTVQGNTEGFNEHRIKISEIYEDLADDVVLNCKQWGIEDSHLDGFIATLMVQIDYFLSRTIKNAERDSLGMGSQKETVSVYKQGAFGPNVGGVQNG
jgi:hypothetical protein